MNAVICSSGMVFLWLISFMFLFPQTTVTAAPVSYITEEIEATYFWNGSLDGNVSRVGYVEVDVGNTVDVMQYLVLELSGISGTSLQNTTAYQDVAASPNSGDRTRIYMNTTQDIRDLSYDITNESLAPLIGINMSYQNDMGGYEVYSTGRNTFYFNLTLNTTLDVSGVSLVFQAARNTNGVNDSLDFFGPSATSGSVQRVDSDSDGMYDRIVWNGDLIQGSDVIVSCSAYTTPGSNFDESYMYVNLDSGETRALYSVSGQTFTGISFVDRFSRGSLRQGIEMMKRDVWYVRGFIKNMANALDYIVHGWELYKIGESVPVAGSSSSTYLTPGDVMYTDWHNTTEGGKAYYSSAFDWELTWGGSGYSSSTQSNMHMPTLYEIDSWVDKTVVLDSNTASGRTVSVTDTIRHLGYSGLLADRAEINSVIPRLSQGGAVTSWTVSNVSVYYSNASGQSDVTGLVSITTKNSDSNEDGFVFVNASGLVALLGGIDQNEDMVVTYQVTSSALSSNQVYSFDLSGTLVTSSGTPVTETTSTNLTIPGVSVPTLPAPSGAPGAPAAPELFADIVKESSELSLITPGFVSINVSYRVMDTGDKGIKNVKAMVYIPRGGKLEKSDLHLKVYRASTGITESLEINKDFAISDSGLTKIGDKDYMEYLVKMLTEEGELYERTLDLYNDDRLLIDYTAKIPFGTNYILTRAFGYNYYEDKTVFEDIWTPVRREIELEVLEFVEGEWEMGMAEVGKPVRWIKRFTITNPNKIPVEEMFSTEVFPDVLTANLIDSAGDGEKTHLELKKDKQTYVNWIARLGEMETKVYLIEVTTPPVMKISETLDVLESSEALVKFVNNITLRNFASHMYKNVSLIYPVSQEKIISISGIDLLLEESDGGTLIIIGKLLPNQTKELSIIYKQRPPVIVTTPDALRYGCHGFANVSILIIPAEDERFAYLEVEVMGPHSELKTAWIDLIETGEIKRFKEAKISVRLDLSRFPDGKYLFVSKFKKNFGTILTDQREFFVDCPERQITVVSYVVFLAIGIAVAVLLVLRVYRRRTYEREIEKLKRRIRKL